MPALKNTRKLSPQQQNEKEGVAILESLQPTDHVVLLDENGKQLSSVGFSTFLENTFNRSVRQLVFVIGGPYGFSAAVYERANEKISLYSMTFRSEERRVGKESVSTCRSRWSPYH